MRKPLCIALPQRKTLRALAPLFFFSRDSWYLTEYKAQSKPLIHNETEKALSTGETEKAEYQQLEF